MPLPSLFNLRQGRFGMEIAEPAQGSPSLPCFLREQLFWGFDSRGWVWGTSFCTPSDLLLLLPDGLPRPRRRRGQQRHRETKLVVGRTLLGLVHQLRPQFRNRDNKSSILCLTPLGSCLLDHAGTLLGEKKNNQQNKTRSGRFCHQRKNGLTSKKRKARIYHSSPAIIVRKKP